MSIRPETNPSTTPCRIMSRSVATESASRRPIPLTAAEGLGLRPTTAHHGQTPPLSGRTPHGTPSVVHGTDRYADSRTEVSHHRRESASARCAGSSGLPICNASRPYPQWCRITSGLADSCCGRFTTAYSECERSSNGMRSRPPADRSRALDLEGGEACRPHQANSALPIAADRFVVTQLHPSSTEDDPGCACSATRASVHSSERDHTLVSYHRAPATGTATNGFSSAVGPYTDGTGTSRSRK